MPDYRMIIFDEDDETVVVDRVIGFENDNEAKAQILRIRRGRRARLERAGSVAQRWESEPENFMGSNIVPLARITRNGPWSPHRGRL
jgi:hypothetical protein